MLVAANTRSRACHAISSLSALAQKMHFLIAVGRVYEFGTNTMTSVSSDSTQTVWIAAEKLPERSTLHGNTTADVCIVGAGIAGLTTAYLLGKAGKKVVVLDYGPVGGGQTQFTTAHLSNAIDDRYFEIERLHGEEGSRLAAESHTAAIDTIERIVADEEIDCDFSRLDGYLFVPAGEPIEILEREYNAALRTGVVSIERVTRAPMSFDTGPCLRFHRQAQFHPLKYMAQLVKAVERDGGRIYTHTHAKGITGGADASVGTTDGFKVSSKAIVVATNTPINDRYAIHTKQAAYRSYVIGCRIPTGSVFPALYWDTLDAYHYVRLQPASGHNGTNYDTLIVGGEDHKTGQATDGWARFERLESSARVRFPMIQDVPYRWSGQVMETIDGLAFIGHNPLDEDNVYIATGDSGMGMTHGTIAGLLLTELILGNKRHRWQQLYDPARKTIGAIGTFVSEGLNVAKEYGAWLTAGDVSSEDEIPFGSGALVRHGVRKLAVYRDERGRLSRCWATCPHLKCFVEWNGVEKTWDCPCHGSRFDPFGKVINGPANADLDRATSKELGE